MALKGIQVLELAGLAPAPFCGMVLSDFGAKVIRIDKLTSDASGVEDILAHGKLSVAINFKSAKGLQIFKELSSKSDVLIDPYRPGVLEKLKVGPTELMGANKRLIYARLTGYGQDGPLSKAAGHDLNYSSISGALSFLGGRAEAPCPPVNVLADFAGGGLSLALGITMALHERSTSGMGQIVDCSMTRGASYVSSWLFRGIGFLPFCTDRGQNLLDGGAFFYDVYKTKDGKWMAVASVEPKFYHNLLKGLNIDEDELPQMSDPEIGRERLTKAFAQHEQDHWENIFSKLDACVTPVLTPQEAAAHKHNIHQKAYDTFPDGILAPTPEPRLNRTPTTRDPKGKAPLLGEHTVEILKTLGYTDDSLRKLLEAQVIAIPDMNSKL